VPERNANFFQVAVGQLGQDISVDRAVAEGRLILAKPQASEPIPNIHHRIPDSSIFDTNRSSASGALLPNESFGSK
jgi:hypothetical protein